MNLHVRDLVVISGLLWVCSANTYAEETLQQATAFRFAPVNDASLGLWEGDKPVLVYNHREIQRDDIPGARSRACYFHPVYGLDGKILTDDFPKDHLYHRGMYWAWPHIKIGDHEYDLWSFKGGLQQRFVRWLDRETTPKQAKLSVENGWFVGDRQLVSEQVTMTVLSATPAGRFLDLELRWLSLEEPITLWGAEGKSYGGFNFRFGPRTVTRISVPEDAATSANVAVKDGKITDDLVMTRLPWVDFVGNFGGDETLSGAAIFVHPQHRDFPPTWMVRHYGLVSVGWPGVTPQTFPANEPIVCRYRIWIHDGSPSQAEVQRQFEQYREGL